MISLLGVSFLRKSLKFKFRRSSNERTSDPRTHNTFIITAALGMALILGGCSGGGDSTNPTTSSPATPTSADPSTTGTARVFYTPVDLVEVSSSNKATIDVSWLPASDGITPSNAVNYQVHASTAATFTPSPSTLKFEGTGVLSTQLTGLLAATRYTVALVASTSSGYESISEPLRVTTSSLTTTLVAGTTVVTPSTSQVVTISPYQMTLTSAATAPKAGEFIASTQNGGILRKVTSVSTNASGTVVQTQAASLNQVVSAIDFSSAIKLTAVPAATSAAKLNKGVTFLRSAGGETQMKWEQTGFSLSSLPTNQSPQKYLSKAATTAAAQASNMYVDTKNNTKVGNWADFNGPAAVSIVAGTEGTIELNANVIKDDSGNAVAICKVEVVSPDPMFKLGSWTVLTSNAVSLPSGGSFPATQSATQALTISAVGIEARAEPYQVELRLFVDDAGDECSGANTFSLWKEKLVVSTEVYVVSTPVFPKAETKALTFTGNFSVTNNVSYTFDPTLEAEVTIDKTGLTPSLQHVRLESISRAAITQTLTVSATGAATLNEIQRLIEPRTFLKVYMAGAVPIVMAGEFSTDIRIQGSVTGALTATEELTFALEDMRYGIVFNNGAWTTISNVRPTYNLKISGDGSAEAHLTVTLIPRLTIKFYEAAAGRMVVSPYLNADAGIAGQIIADVTPAAISATADYWLTQGQIGGGVDAYLMADFKVLDYTLVQWPSTANTADYTSFKKISLLPQTSIAGLPTLTATLDSVAKHPTNSRAFLIKGTAVDIPNPLQSLFGSGPASFIPFSTWHKPLVVATNATDYTFIDPPQGSAAGDVWVVFNKSGNYTVRLGGNSSMGGWARQIAEAVVSITDTNTNGINDQWETKYGLTGTGAAIAAADPDGDGISNLQEFNLGTDPLVANPPINGVDTIAPTVTPPANITVTAAQGATTVSVLDTAIVNFLTGATATDNVGVVGVPPVTNDAGPSFPIGTTTVTFSATDAAGNVGTATATVTVNAPAPLDTTPPTITLIGAATVSVDQGTSYVDAGATAQDTVDGDLTTSIATNNPVNTSAIGTYQVTYDVSDLSGNAATQVVRTVNVVVPVAAGNYALQFDGVNDQISLGTGITVGSSFTQESWIRPTSNDSLYHGFIGNQPGATDITRSPSLWVLGNGAGKYAIAFGFGAGINFVNNTFGITPYQFNINEWVHIAASYDAVNKVYNIYANGINVYTKNLPNAVPSLDTPIKFIGSVDNYFAGSMDDVQIWNTARTQTQIQADMYTQLTGNEAGLVGYWNFNEGTGNIANDATANANQGSLGAGVAANMPAWVPSTVSTVTPTPSSAWIKHGTPVLNIGAAGSLDGVHTYDPSVIYTGTEYRMYYNMHDGTNVRVGLATSVDGITWVKNATNPVVNIGVAGSRDSVHAHAPNVLFDGVKYQMWYDGFDGVTWRICHATSVDGVTWVKDTNMQLNLGAGWDATYVYNASVVFDAVTSTYHMWYSGFDGVKWAIGYASSIDGLSWVRNANNPILTSGLTGQFDSKRVYAASVKKTVSGYEMWYTGSQSALFTGADVEKIGHATSIDGVAWIKDVGNPVLHVGVTGEFDNIKIRRPSIVDRGNKREMWYTGFDGTNWRVSYASKQLTPLVSINNGLVAYYPLDGNANDASGNANNGVASGLIPAVDRLNSASKSYQFSGAFQNVVAPDAPQLNLGTGALTISAWIQTTQTGSWKRIISKRTSTYPVAVTGNWYSLAINNGKADFEIFAGGDLLSTKNVNDGLWHLITITRDKLNNTFNMYIDGVLNSSMPDVGLNLDTGGVGASLEIGSWSTELYDSGTFTGQIDDVRIYNRTLSATEIQSLAAVGTISTIAGNGVAAFSGDGGAAASASLHGPHGITVDSLGNTYIGDFHSSRIRKINTSGIISTIAGNGSAVYSGDGGLAVNASLVSAARIAVGNANNLFIVGGNRIRKIDNATGLITTIAGNGVASSTGDGSQATLATLFTPMSIAISNNGDLYIAELDGHRIRKVSAATGIISTVAGTGVAGYAGDGALAVNAQLSEPVDIEIDNLGNLVFVEYNNHVVRHVNTTTGVISTLAGTGTAGYSGDGALATNASFNIPYSISVDKANNLFIGDYANNRIRRVDAITGIITTVAGNGTIGFSGDGGSAISASFQFPSLSGGAAVDTAFDLQGNLLIADFGNNRIREVRMVAP